MAFTHVNLPEERMVEPSPWTDHITVINYLTVVRRFTEALSDPWRTATFGDRLDEFIINWNAELYVRC